MKKVISVGLVSTMLFGLALTTTSCDNTSKGGFTAVAKENVKVGLICLHDSSSSYDANFINSMNQAIKNLGLREDQLELVTGVGENKDCYDKAAELAQTCNVVFGDSFGHEDFLIQAATEFTDVRFCHATGTKAHTAGLDNFSNAFASIYEGRYLAGLVAGQKLTEMINDGKFSAEEAKIGYVGAFPYAEVKSGYTSFFLGARAACPSVTMEVRFTGSWYDYDAEETAAKALIANNCKLISGHADSYGAPTACETHKDSEQKADPIPNVAYNISTADKCPESYLVSSKIDWTPYFEYMIGQVIAGEKIKTDWTGTIATGSVALTEYGKGVSQAAKDKVEEVKAQMLAGTFHVFDTSKFTVNGGFTLDTYKADVDSDANYTADTEVVSEGYFLESVYRSAPYFDIDIDGITIVENK